MKKTITFLACFLFVLSLYSQEISGHASNRDYYLQKSKRQNTTGGILLGVGTTMTIVGLIGFNENFKIFEPGGNDRAADIYGFIAVTGIVMDLVSIPVFVAASRNKRRGLTVKIDNQNFHQPNDTVFALKNQPIPSITLQITF